MEVVLHGGRKVDHDLALLLTRPTARDYAMSRIKPAFGGLAVVGRLPQEAAGAEEIATDDSDKDSDVDQFLAEVQQPSVGDDDVLVVDEPEPPKPGPRRISKK